MIRNNRVLRIIVRGLYKQKEIKYRYMMIIKYDGRMVMRSIMAKKEIEHQP